VDTLKASVPITMDRPVRLHLPCCQRIKTISCGKQCQAEDSTSEVEIMTNAGFLSPPHPMNDASCFAYMRKDDDHKKY
jgi:hypothetical protein